MRMIQMSMLSPLKFVKGLLAVLSNGVLSCRKKMQGQPASLLVCRTLRKASSFALKVSSIAFGGDPRWAS